MIKKIAGKITNFNKTFFGTIYFNEKSGLIEHLSEEIEKDAVLYPTDSCVIFSGFGDIHVHSREDVSQKHIYKEDFISCSNSAINGGLTFFADMPNNPIPPVDETSYNQKHELTKKANFPIFLYAGIGKNTRPLEKKVPYKVYMSHSIGDLFFDNRKNLEEVLKYYKNQSVSFHCEDPLILEQNKNKTVHEKKRPSEAEVIATENAIELVQKYNLKGKLCHYSTKLGLKKIIEAKKQGLNLECEVSPIHLLFDMSVLSPSNQKYFQMNPPLRHIEDREFLMESLKNGIIDHLATDHAPHTLEEKKNGISGISQLDAYGLFVTHLILEEKVDLNIISKICTENPGNFINQFLNENKINTYGNGFGKVEKGYVANFTILNLEKRTVLKKENIKSKSKWSIFEDFKFPGSIEAVYVLGKKVK